jgi:hypothetical protein
MKGLPIFNVFEQPLDTSTTDNGAGATLDGDVVTDDGDGAAVDGGMTADLAVTGRRRGVERILGSGEGAELLETTGVDERLDPIANGAAATGVELRQPFDTTHVSADDLSALVEPLDQRSEVASSPESLDCLRWKQSSHSARRVDDDLAHVWRAPSMVRALAASASGSGSRKMSGSIRPWS